jgi:hypothetical protein
MSDNATPPASEVQNPNPPQPAGELPPAAQTVLSGTRSETEVQLQAELDAERTRHAKTSEEKKAREVRVAELEDEMHRFKQSTQGKPAPKIGVGWWPEE